MDTQNPVYWSIGNGRLANQHLYIQADSGSGKTTLLFLLAQRLCRAGKKVIIFDYAEKTSYSVFDIENMDKNFTENTGLSVFENGFSMDEGEIMNSIVKTEEHYVQRKAGGDSRLSDDRGGHLVPSSQNGTSDSINITAQNGKVNTRDVRVVERDESSAVKNGATIQTERTAYCSNDPNRPDAYMYSDHVTMPDGTTHDIHHSWINVDMNQYKVNI